ncbi:hypothetical protein [Bradyrhizobium iriomotense]|uniref:hypothetical protein n=1 Tax=Bradyrhizobium iriomotense TaxID=441950 RepID=UPI0024E1084F|nr:hypothetical protein [Bradyrhizobium iriomotense]
MAELPKPQPRGMPSARISMQEPQAIDLLRTMQRTAETDIISLLDLSLNAELGDQTRDEIDKEPHEERFCGYS